MIVDAFALLAICALAYVGWRRGAVLMALSLLGFVGGYTAAMFLHRPVGGLMARFAGMPEVLAYPVAGVLVMLVVGLTFRFVRRRYVLRRARDEREGWEASRLYRGGGAAIAGVVAVGIAMVVVWIATVVTELSGRRVPMLAESYTGRLGAAAAEKSVYGAARLAGLDPQVASGIAGVMARPGRAAQALQSVLRSELFASLRADRSFRDAFLSGDATSLRSHPMMERMTEDPSFQQAFDVLNLTEGPEGFGEGPDHGLAATLSTLGGSLQDMGGDGGLQANPLAVQIQEGITSGSLDLVQITRSPQLASMLTQINASFRARDRAMEHIIR